ALQVRVVFRMAEADAIAAIRGDGKDEIATDAMIEFAQKNEMTTGQLATEPCMHLVALPAQPIVVHHDDRASELRDVRGHLARPLLLECELTQMPVRRRLKPRSAIEREPMMERVAQKIERDRK